MTVSASLRKLFRRHKVNYRVYYYKETRSLHLAAKYLDIPTTKIITASVLEDQSGYVLAITPLNSSIDFPKLKKKLNRNLSISLDFKSNRIFYDCQSGNFPPFGRPYNVDVVMDKSITNLDKIYCVAGSNSSIVEMSVCDFLYVNSDSKRFSFTKSEQICTKSLDIPNAKANTEETWLNEKLSSQAKYYLPNLPLVAKQILELISNKEAPINEIAEIISKDDFIYNQIKNFSDSSFFKNKYEKVDSSGTEQDNQLLKFLSFDTVSHIAFSAAFSKAFTIKQNQEEVKKYWRHAIFSGALAYNLAEKIISVNKNTNIEPEKCYLAGLLHNIGFILFAQLFPPEFKLLVKWKKLYPKVPINILEKKLLGMGYAMKILKEGHAYLGANLLKFWKMPDYVYIAAKYHHDKDYRGRHFEYVLLIQLVNQLLADVNIGDCYKGELNNNLFDFFEIDRQYAKVTLANLLEDENNFDHIASVMTN